MAKIHVLTRERGGFDILVHFAVPGGMNDAGITWQTAGLGSGMLGGESDSPDAGEVAAVAAGSLIELRLTANIHPEDSPPAAAATALRAIADKAIADWTAEAAMRLRYWGLEVD